ncbi:PD40 domain-containing protein [Hymenobacter sediminicola]|uniref:PD40 domain-containing protein n=1 Tax=Hymenobacter sediminicola TaxID=2761579 RepID=A0A7G7W9Y8_9BACT|nr:PD40 domain-containing protein [Hymenobacter sediminicola]QNH63181.1 PD40 domain-containing protein [Hymenobacter sediminicola]
MKRLLLLPLLLLLLLPSAARAQREQSIWYFGQQAGLSFPVGGAAPTPLLNNKMTTYEGSAVATNAQGQLLFYTNGEYIFNRQHAVMPNGRKLMGSNSSTQSALVVPDPGSGNVFYVFTVAAQGTSNGLRYSVVDMTRENGLGDVPRANMLLITPVAEKLTAVRHQNGRDVWIVAHRWNSNAFVSFLITAEGVQTKPIMSNVGSMHAGPGRNAIGAMKFSPDGRKLAVALWREANKYEVFDFDRSTGLVSNPKTFAPYPEAYGVEFSPDGSKLYGSSNGEGGGQAQIFQFDLKTGAATVVGKSANRKVGSLQRAPDGKIYIAREDNQFLGIIENPNAEGTAAKYIDDGLKLGGRRSKLGLPNFLTEPGK